MCLGASCALIRILLMYKDADMSHQYKFPAQFSKNNRCYLLGTTPDFSCLFIVPAILVSHESFSYIVPFQLTYVERLPFRNGKESSHD
jgi:hypothetical protein